jgi:hypothetical protein
MADKYVARARLRIGASVVAPGTDVTTSALTWRHLPALLHSGRVVLVQTASHYQFRAKQTVPESPTTLDWHLKPYRRRFSPISLDPIKRGRYRRPF